MKLFKFFKNLRFQSLFKSTNLHGFKLLVYDEDTMSGMKGYVRVFWTTAFAISFYLMFGMLKNVSTKAQSSTAIMPDTSYINWINAFPAVSFCLTKGRSTEPIKQFIMDNMDDNYPKKDLIIRHYRVMQSAMFLNTRDPFEGMTLSHCLEINDSCGIDIEYARNLLLPKTCDKVIDKIFFLGVEMKCQDIFKFYQTELGSCFIANSIYSHTNMDDFTRDFSALPLTYHNRAVDDKTLEIHYMENDFMLYKFAIHSPEEMPDVQSKTTGLRKPGIINYVALKTTEFVNEPDVIFVSQKSRKCRYPTEKFSNFSLPYCKANCIFLKRVEREIAACNCTLPVGLNVSSTLTKCTMRQVKCVDTLLKKLNLDSTDKNKAYQMVEDCLIPTCTTMEITRIGEFEVPMKDTENISKNIGIIKIEVVNKPSLRYVRRVQFTKLDIIGESF